MRNYLTAPLIVDFNITKRCNLDCKYCYADAGNNCSDELTLEEIKNVLKQLKDLNVLIVRLSGGEPLVRNDYRDIVEYCESLGLVLCTNTNGTLITKDIIDCFRKDCIKKIGISLDSYDEQLHNMIRGRKYAYKKTLDSIHTLVKAGLGDKLSIVITLSNNNANIREIERFIEFLVNNNVKHVSFQYAIPVGRGDSYDDCSPEYDNWKDLIIWLYSKKNYYEETYGIDYVINLTNESDCKFELFFPFIEEKRADLLSNVPGAMSDKESNYISCQAGNITIAITADGKVFPCELMMCYKKLEAGDLRKNTFEYIWNNSTVLNEIRNMKVDELDGICNECSMKSICGGGCRASAYAHSRNLRGCDNRCNRVRESLKNENEELFFDNQRIVVRKEIDGFYFVNPITLKMYHMNKSGYIVFKGIVENLNEEQIVEKLITDIRISREKALEEYKHFSEYINNEFIRR